MLGFVLKKEYIVTDNAPNKHDINITAAMFIIERFDVENYSTRGNCGYINLFGSLSTRY